MSRRLKTTLRVLLSIILLGWLISRIDLQRSWDVIVHVDLRIALAALCMYVFYQLLQTLRWKWLLQPFGQDIGFLSLFRFQLAGIFFGLFLPSAFGGDVAKGLHLGLRYRMRIDSLSSVIMARALGILGLWVFVLIQFVLFFPVYRKQGLVWVVAALSGLCLLALFLVRSWVTRRRARRIRLPARMRFLESTLDSFANSFDQYRRYPLLLISGFLISVGIHFVSYLYDYVVAISLGGTVPLRFFLIYGPLIFLLSTLPLFINGLGIRENGFVYFFTQLEQVSSYWIFSVAVLSYLQVILLGLFGGMLFLIPWRKFRPNAEPAATRSRDRGRTGEGIR